MAVTIADLIAKKEELTNRKKRLYDLETSAGTMTVKLPTRAFMAEASDLEDTNAYLVYNCIVSPDLSDKSLQKAYGCVEPTDIVDKLFDPGEVVGITNKIMELAGWRKDIQSELHKETKN